MFPDQRVKAEKCPYMRVQTGTSQCDQFPNLAQKNTMFSSDRATELEAHIRAGNTSFIYHNTTAFLKLQNCSLWEQ